MSGEPVTVLDCLERAIARLRELESPDRVPPVAILWADRTSDWEAAVERLNEALPIFRLGTYDPERRTGPAYWLRCIVDRALPEAPAVGEVPVLYLPGFSRDDLRATENCPAELQPIAELQYRGSFFGSRSSRDWSVSAFLSNADQGLGVELTTGKDVSVALQRAFSELLGQNVDRLRSHAPLNTSFFNKLLERDATASLLEWLDDPDAARDSRNEGQWEAFRQTCSQEFALDPDNDGVIRGAELLGERDGDWSTVWRRFRESPRRYPNVPERLRQARPIETMPAHPDSWPQDNEEEEEALREALTLLGDKPSTECRAAVAELEKRHGTRRDSIWADLGRAPMALVLGRIAEVARGTSEPVVGETIIDIGKRYLAGGWAADLALLRALANVESSADRVAVVNACRAMYFDWADVSARHMQGLLADADLDGLDVAEPRIDAGVCTMFIDGLRMDVSQWLAEMLRDRDCKVDISASFGALPGVTSTAKPAVAPVPSGTFAGGSDFDVVFAANGKSVNARSLRTAISEAGIAAFGDGEVGDPSVPGWTEFGNIDSIGHGGDVHRFAHDLEPQLLAITDRIRELLAAGWKAVRAVTDHGWLYLPGGLPKANLPEHLTVKRKGRAARLAEGGSTDHPVVPWAWDPEVRVATAPGLSCYVEGKTYEHGGVSAQEWITPVLDVAAIATSAVVELEEPEWVGMRVRISVGGAPKGAQVELRGQAGDPGSRISAEALLIGDGGKASLLVDDPDAEGRAALVVVLSADGDLLAQRPTSVGG